MASHKSQDYTDAYRRGTTFFINHGFKSRYERLDNETSQELEAYFREQQIAVQYVFPHQQSANKAERVIRTFKNHWIASHCTTDSWFPLSMWDRTLEQAVLTLNHLRDSAINPNISAWEQLHGRYDFNAAPIAPIGMKIVIHEKPAQRQSWAPHGVDGWYLGRARHHYRCYRVFAAKIKAERITDTVAWHPQPFVMPKSDPVSALTTDVQAALHLPRTTTVATARSLRPETETDRSEATAVSAIAKLVTLLQG